MFTRLFIYYNYFFIIALIIGIWIALWIYKKLRLLKLKKEEKNIYYSALEKIKNITITNKIFVGIGILCFIIISVIKKQIFPSECLSGLGIMVRLTLKEEISLVAQYYIIIFYIAYRCFNNIYISRKIDTFKDLSENEKILLQKYYVGNISKYIISPLIMEVFLMFCNMLFTTADKPIIYIYPEKKQKVKVKLDKTEILTHTFPAYNTGWEIEADTDGTLVDSFNKKYYSLYYECINNFKVNEKIGFCIKGSDTSKFLEEKLEILGLNFKERQEFIIYWLPQMENNKYNYIYFANEEEINNTMGLEITPKPSTLIRIMMYFKPLKRELPLQEQKINNIKRKGYTVVEWGGTKIK